LEVIPLINSFNSKAVSKIIGIPFRVIDYWDRTAFIKPSISEASGYGSVRLYSFTYLIQFRVAISQGSGTLFAEDQKEP
jgi:DNA-binding transcriptional MerR regulator